MTRDSYFGYSVVHVQLLLTNPEVDLLEVLRDPLDFEVYVIDLLLSD